MRDVEEALKPEDLLQKAPGILQNVDQSPIFKQRTSRLFPSFELEELEIGNVLGVGSFGVVKEIIEINCKAQSQCDEISGNSSNRTQKGDRDLQSEKISEEKFCSAKEENNMRNLMSQRCLRGHESRYALKSLMKTKLDDLDWARGRIDLAIEVKYLKALDHPNIIRIRGVFRTNNPIHPFYFFLMDRLYDTLETRIKDWKCEKKEETRGFFRKPDKSFLALLWVERLIVACDIASALKYMHQNKVMHRDIKPENIGFDIRGDVKLFDFGMAKSLHPTSRLPNDDLYNLTGMVGSYPYMSPEVAKMEPYNEKCDVFSYAIVLYEIVVLKEPFKLKNRNIASLHQMVAVKGHRPSIPNSSCSQRIEKLLKASWMQASTDRPTMKLISEEISDELEVLGNDMESRERLLGERSNRSINATLNNLNK
mmetsp:Transcript_19798/g.29748  ORF Transcript_19798/g.29748 Transcript_19798/m.29748 type:complete len:424 (+) Transcript_19798:185-1456(+)